MRLPVPKETSIKGRKVIVKVTPPSYWDAHATILNHRPTMEALIPYFKMETWSKSDIRERYETFERKRREGTCVHFSIVRKSDGRVLGEGGFKDIDQEKSCAEFGIINHQDIWGTYAAVESVILMLDFAFDELKLKWIYMGSDSWNEQTMRLFSRIKLTAREENGFLYFDMSQTNWNQIKETNPIKQIIGKRSAN